MKKKILINDDHPSVLLGLALCVSSIKGFEAVERTAFTEQEMTQIKQHEYCLAIIDYRLNAMLGTQICSIIKQLNPKVKTILLSGILDASFINQVWNNEVDGMLSKQADISVIEQAIRTLLSGKKYQEKSIRHKLDNGLSSILKKVQNITKREKDVIRLLIQGMNNKDIARELFISTKTVESHKDALKQKFAVKSSNELLVFCSKYSEIIFE